MTRRRAWLLLLAVAALSACAKHEAGGAMPMARLMHEAPQGEFLAYEHEVDVALEAGQIPARLKSLQDSCQRKTHGECVVLHVSQRGGDDPGGELAVRIVPAGVEPMIAAASSKGEIGNRSTEADDLAEVVRDNTLTRTRLQKEQTRLLEFQQRRDLSVADMIALSRQLSQVEAKLLVAEQEAAQHQRRIRTQKLTLRFQTPDGQSGRGEIRQAVRDFFATLATGTAWTIRAIAFLIPVLVALWMSYAMWRRLRRRKAG